MFCSGLQRQDYTNRYDYWYPWTDQYFKIHSSYPEVPNLTLNGVHIDMSQFERLSSHRGSSSQATSVEEVGVTCQ